jgi:cobalt/nickel transport system permease protein
MLKIDQIAYKSRLKDINPLEKLIFFIIIISTTMILDNLIVSIFVILEMCFITIYINKLNFKHYLRLIKLPLIFIVISILTIIITISVEDRYLIAFSIGIYKIGIKSDGLMSGFNIFTRIMAMISTLYFLILTTPMTNIFSVLIKLKIPRLLIELMTLVYRYIFIMLEISNDIYVAQFSRCGYISLKKSYLSLGKLAGIVFIKSFKKADDIYNGLESRGYDGRMNYITKEYKIVWKNYLYIVLNLILILLIYTLSINI